MREALSGTSSQRFTVSPASISFFLGVCGLVGVGCVWFGVLVFVLVCVCVCLCSPHE